MSAGRLIERSTYRTAQARIVFEAGGVPMAHVILFQHKNFPGAHKHVFGAYPTLDASDDNFFNDKVSSIVVLEGRWEFFADSNFHSKTGATLSPGDYPDVTAPGVNIQNDAISSLRPV